jgi:hypothetical protein
VFVTVGPPSTEKLSAVPRPTFAGAAIAPAAKTAEQVSAASATVAWSSFVRTLNGTRRRGAKGLANGAVLQRTASLVSASHFDKEADNSHY